MKITKVNTIPTDIPAGTNVVKSKPKESITFEAIREVITLFGKGIGAKGNGENLARKSNFSDNDTNNNVTSNGGVDNIRLNKFSHEDLVTFAIINEIPRRTFFKLFNIKARELARKSVPKAKVYCFRTRSALFGHNAPQFEVLPAEIKSSTIKPFNWSGDQYMDIQNYPEENTPMIKKIHLDNIYPKILPNSWIVLLSNDLGSKACFVSDTTETSLVDFLINAKITALILKEDKTIKPYKLRETTVFAESEELELTDEVPLPLDDSSSLNENGIILDHVLDGLNIGYRLQ